MILKQTITNLVAESRDLATKRLPVALVLLRRLLSGLRNRSKLPLDLA